MDYTKRHRFPEVASRIKECLGTDIKLIYIVRDPINRFQSNFTDSKTYGDIPSSYSINTFIEEKLADNPLVKTSMYYYQIEAFLSCFSLKNIYFLKAEDLKKNPQETMNRLFYFLDLEPVLVTNIVQNQSVSKTYYSTKYLILNQSPLVEGIKRLFPKKVIAFISGSKIVQTMAKNPIDPKIDVLSKKNRAFF